MTIFSQFFAISSILLANLSKFAIICVTINYFWGEQMVEELLNKIAIFQKKEIRRVIYRNEWWFVVEDAVLALIDSQDPKQYIQRMKLRDPELKKGWVQFVHTLLIDTAGGQQKMNCANAEGIFRIIQSIPSPKAEPFKRWLAKVGYERVQEIDDPELGMKRTRALYKAKGYPEDWIENRIRTGFLFKALFQFSTYLP